MITPKLSLVCSAVTLTLVIGLASSSAFADLSVNGTPGSQFTTNQTNVYSSANSDPTTQSTVGVGLVIADGSVSGSGTGTASGSLSVQSGTFTVNAGNTSFVGQGNTTGSGTLNVSGGTFNLNSPGNTVVFANNGGHSTVNLSGGVFNLSVGAGQSILYGRDGGVAAFNITGGLFTTNATSFTLDTNSTSQSGGPLSVGIITFGAGAGEFRFTNTPTTFNLGSATRSYFEFDSGSGGKLSINGYTQSQFDGFVNDGSIRIDGFAADPSSFVYSNVGGIGTYQLLTVPEPTTWILLAAGAAGVLLINSRRRTV